MCLVSRFDYDGEEMTRGQQNLWDANVERALNGRKGQAMLRELEQALLALPHKRLIDSDFKQDGDVCVVGALAIQRVKRFLETDDFQTAYSGLPDFEGEPDEIAWYAETHLGMSRLLAWHLQFKNDEEYAGASPELRYDNMLQWVRSRIVAVPS